MDSWISVVDPIMSCDVSVFEFGGVFFILSLNMFLICYFLVRSRYLVIV